MLARSSSKTWVPLSHERLGHVVSADTCIVCVLRHMQDTAYIVLTDSKCCKTSTDDVDGHSISNAR